MIPIAVVIPVGPKPVHSQWLDDMLKSIAEQTSAPREVVLINDGGDTTVTGEWRRSLLEKGYRGTVVIHDVPWSVGPSDCMNIGVAVSAQRHVIMACADDQLLPTCVQACWQRWNEVQHPLGYYYLGVRYSDGGEQNTACGAAMVTKDLWNYTGGFPHGCGVGAADHIFLSALIAGGRDGYSQAQILRVSDEVQYWYRKHPDTMTSKNIWPAIEAVKERFTHDWRPNYDFSL